MSDALRQQLFTLFCEIFDGLNIEQDEIKRLFDDLCDVYQENGRFYHTLEHLVDLTDEFEKHRETFGAEAQAVLLTLFYHDIVYNCVPGQDEKDSAEAMIQTLTGIIDPAALNRANDIILMTASHSAPDNDKAARLFLDMDMAILGAPPENYARYLHQVTQEFCTAYGISAEDFHQKRAELFLKPTIENGRQIFTTDEYAPLEQQAHNNIQSELNKNDHFSALNPEI